MKDVKKCEDEELLGMVTACACSIGKYVANAPCGKDCTISPVITRMHEIIDELDVRSPGFKKQIEGFEGTVCS